MKALLTTTMAFGVGFIFNTIQAVNADKISNQPQILQAHGHGGGHGGGWGHHSGWGHHGGWNHHGWGWNGGYWGGGGVYIDADPYVVDPYVIDEYEYY